MERRLRNGRWITKGLLIEGYKACLGEVPNTPDFKDFVQSTLQIIQSAGAGL